MKSHLKHCRWNGLSGEEEKKKMRRRSFMGSVKTNLIRSMRFSPWRRQPVQGDGFVFGARDVVAADKRSSIYESKLLHITKEYSCSTPITYLIM